MAKKKQKPFSLGKKSEAEFNRLIKNAKAKIRRTKQRYGVDISSQVDLRSADSFTSRKQFNAWKKNIGNLKNRADLNFRNVGGVIASQSEINLSNRQTNLLLSGLEKIGKDTYRNQHGLVFSGDKLRKQILQRTVGIATAKQEIARLSELPSVQSEDRKTNEMARKLMMQKQASATKINIPKQITLETVQRMEEPRQQKLYEESSERLSNRDRYSNAMDSFYNTYVNRLEQLIDEGDEFSSLLEKIKNMNPEEFYDFFLYFKDSGMEWVLYSSDMQAEVVNEQIEGIKSQIKASMKTYESIKENIDHLKM